jgi:hypothetical protein
MLMASDVQVEGARKHLPTPWLQLGIYAGHADRWHSLGLRGSRTFTDCEDDLAYALAELPAASDLGEI